MVPSKSSWNSRFMRYIFTESLTVDSSLLNASGVQILAVAFAALNSTVVPANDPRVYVPFTLAVAIDHSSCAQRPLSVIRSWRVLSETASMTRNRCIATDPFSGTCTRSETIPVLPWPLNRLTNSSLYSVVGDQPTWSTLLDAIPIATALTSATLARTELAVRRPDCDSVGIRVAHIGWFAVFLQSRSMFCGPSNFLNCTAGLPTRVIGEASTGDTAVLTRFN